MPLDEFVASFVYRKIIEKKRITIDIVLRFDYVVSISISYSFESIDCFLSFNKSSWITKSINPLSFFLFLPSIVYLIVEVTSSFYPIINFVSKIWIYLLLCFNIILIIYHYFTVHSFICTNSSFNYKNNFEGMIYFHAPVTRGFVIDNFLAYQVRFYLFSQILRIFS